MSYTDEDGEVVLHMSRADYESVLLALGMATGLASKEGRDTLPWLELVNRLNHGNPNFVPYKVG